MGATRLDDLDTPCLTVDLDVFERNVRTCLSSLARVHVRPHLKTAKSPEVARLLIDAGAVGVCVAKLSEAEVMLAERDRRRADHDRDRRRGQGPPAGAADR